MLEQLFSILLEKPLDSVSKLRKAAHAQTTAGTGGESAEVATLAPPPSDTRIVMQLCQMWKLFRRFCEHL